MSSLSISRPHFFLVYLRTPRHQLRRPYATRLASTKLSRPSPRFIRNASLPPLAPRSPPLPSGYTYYDLHNDLVQPTYTAYTMPNVIESPHAPPPLPRMSVFDYLFPPKLKGKQTQWYDQPNPESVAFIDGLTGRQLKRGELGARAKAIATGLRKVGVERRSVVLIFGMNSLEWIQALMGAQVLHCIVSPANYAYTPDELLHQIKDSTAQTVFVTPAQLPVLEKALATEGAPEIAKSRIILLCTEAAKPKGAEYMCIDELDGKPTEPKRLSLGDEKATAYLCYSSGTTGRAKGVETSHHNMTSQLQALNLVYEPLQRRRDVVLGILPLSHIYGLTIVLHQPLTKGVPVVILPRFEEVPVLEAIQKHKITWALIVPPILLALLHSKVVSKYDISSLRAMQSGAAPLGIELTNAFEKKFNISLTQGYGLTETSPVTHVMTAAESRSHPGQIGQLMPTFQCRLVDADSGEDVKFGERGEMWFRGPSVMKGYWRNPEATANTFAPGGWFKTGDVAVVDDRGYFTVVDRLKELIKYKGFQVPPAELEALLLSHPKVADVAVIGVYSEEQATELPRAYITPAGGLEALPKDKHDALKSEISTWLQERVANHKRLRGGIVFIETVPKSPSGKILRKDLRVLAKNAETRKAKL